MRLTTRPLSVPSLRDTFGTRLYHETGDLCLVERALGPRPVAPTEVYARVSDEALRVAIARGRKINLRAGVPPPGL
jgi:integrase